VPIAFLLALMFSIGVYLYFPKIIYRGTVAATLVILKVSGKDQPYETTYGIHPCLLHKIELVIEEANSKGIDLRVVRGYRSPKEQQRLYNIGRNTPGGIVTYARPGFSDHNYGLAVDVCEYTNGQPNWQSERWDEIGAIGKNMA